MPYLVSVTFICDDYAETPTVADDVADFLDNNLRNCNRNSDSYGQLAISREHPIKVKVSDLNGRHLYER